MSNFNRKRRRQRLRYLVCCILTFAQTDGFQPTPPTFSSISLQFGRRIRARLPKNVASIYQEDRLSSLNMEKRKMVANSLEVPSSSSSPSNFANQRDLERRIVQLGRAGKTDQALKLYSDVDHPVIRLMNSAIDACSRARPTRLEQAFQIFEAGVKDHGLTPNVFTFGALMNACNRDRNSIRALELLKLMQTKYKVLPNAVVYSSAISACARSQPPKADQALRLLKEAVEENSLPMNVVGFNAAISACAQAGDWENAIGILTRMKEALDNNKSSFTVPQPDAVTYGTVLAACERSEQWRLVLTYAQEMKEKDLMLDGLAITSCLHACQQLGLAKDALFYLQSMKSLSDSATKGGRSQRVGARQPLMGPDAVAYRLAISACARGGAWRDGIQLLEEYKGTVDEFSDVVAYTAAITGCEYAGKWEHALALLDKMRKDGVTPNEVTLAAVIGACATACAQCDITVGQSPKPEAQRKALQLLEVAKTRSDFPDPNIQVYNAAIRVCAEAFDAKEAFRLLEEIEEKKIERTLITYGSMMTACERIGCVDSASRVFRKLKDDGLIPNEIIYGAAISCCRKAKQSERAFLLLKKMMKENLSPNSTTFNTVLMAQTERKSRADTERAILVYKLMKSKFVSNHGRPNRKTYNILINFFASNLQPNTAEAFLGKMQDEGFKPDVNLFTATVASYEKTGQPLRALRLMESMQDDGYDFYGVTVLNEAFKKAVQLANKVGNKLTSGSDSRDDADSIKLIGLVEDDDDNLILEK